MPVYNSERYLNKAITSIIEQTYLNWELIIVNDGSVDDSKKICDEYSRQDKRIKVIHQKNRGVSASRNKALENASGDYICFVDSDDWVNKFWLEKTNKSILNNPNIDLIVNGWVEEYSNFSKKQTIIANDCKMSNSDFKEYYVKMYNANKFPGFCCNKVYKKSVLADLRFREDFNIVEDEIYNYEVYKSSKEILLISDTFYHYRRNTEISLTKVAKFRREKNIYYNAKQFYEIINKFYKDWNVEENKYTYDIKRKYISSIYDCLVNISIFEEDYKNKFKYINEIVNDEYFQDILSAWEYIENKNKVLKVTYYIGRFKNKYIAYIIIKFIYNFSNIKNKILGRKY